MQTVPFANQYSITEDGVLIRNGRALRPRVNKGGYLTHQLSVEGKVSTHTVHRLVALTFIPNPDRLPVVDHVDGDKLNNARGNLRWVRHEENTRLYWAARRGRCIYTRKVRGKYRAVLNLGTFATQDEAIAAVRTASSLIASQFNLTVADNLQPTR